MGESIGSTINDIELRRTTLPLTEFAKGIERGIGKLTIKGHDYDRGTINQLVKRHNCI